MPGRIARWGRTQTGAQHTRYRLRLLAIPDTPEFLRATYGAITFLADEQYWTDDAAAAQHAADALEMFYDMVNSDIVGTIVPYITTNPPNHTLPLDGSTHNQADYPLLFDRLDAVYKSGTQFTLPDLRGRFILGADAPNFNLGDVGGAEDHVLTPDEMPAHTHIADPHTHTNAPHTHSEIIPTPVIINGGIEAPANAAIPTTSVTGASSVVIDNATVTNQPAGDDQPHNNMPPFGVVKYAVVAI